MRWGIQGGHRASWPWPGSQQLESYGCKLLRNLEILAQRESKGREIARANSCQSFLLFDSKTGWKDEGKGGWREGRKERMQGREDGGGGGECSKAVAVTEPPSGEAPGIFLVDNSANKQRKPDPGEVIKERTTEGRKPAPLKLLSAFLARLQGAHSPQKIQTSL